MFTHWVSIFPVYVLLSVNELVFLLSTGEFCQASEIRVFVISWEDH